MFNWDDYLKLAKDLILPEIKRSSDEACLRTAVSRAYYAAYNKAERYARVHGYAPPKENKHEALIKFFAMNDDQNMKIISAKLGIVKKDRVRCDYYDSLKNVNPNKAIKTAEEIISEINTR